MESDWKSVEVGSGVQLRSPVELAKTGARGIDSRATVWEGRNLTVMVDEGPFSDPLTSYSDRPNARISQETISGHPARVVGFRLDDGRDFAAIHFVVEPDEHEAQARKVTISVTGRDEMGGEVPLKIAKSVELGL